MAFPQLMRAVRQAPFLARADRLWRLTRPWYDASLRVLYGRRGFPLKVGAGEWIRVDPSCRSYVWEEQEEDALWAAVMSEIQAGDRVADVGASIGAYTIGAAKRGALVASYEPNPDVAALLQRHVELNHVADRVEVREVALGEVEREAHLAAGGTLDMASRIDATGALSVRMERLDEQFDIVKIDVEGYELEVLQGASALLADRDRRPRCLFVELHRDVLRARGIDPGLLGASLSGYELTRIATLEVNGREHWVVRSAASRT
jgi:FkbM family methyltransferase